MELTWARSAPTDLAAVRTRISYLYVEQCRIHREDGAISMQTERGVAHCPAAGLALLLAGPGTTMTQQAVSLLGDSGCTVCWVGERGAVFYAVGRSTTSSSVLAERQAAIVSDPKARVEAARRMYLARFPEDDAASLPRTLAGLRGKEGARMKVLYAEMAKRHGVPWGGRRYVPGVYEASDTVNQAISCGNTILYGLAVAVIESLGMSPSLGVVHSGSSTAFALDIADLHKADTSIPIGFEVAAGGDVEVPRRVRAGFRKRSHDLGLLPAMVKSIHSTMVPGDPVPDSANGAVGYLWDNKIGVVESRRNHSR